MLLGSKNRARGLNLLVVLGLSLIADRGVAARPDPTEYRLKAAFLLNFARFVEWPPANFSENTTPLAVGILGEDPFGSILDQTLEGEEAQGRGLLVHRGRALEELPPCHVIFICRSEEKDLPEILARLRQRGVLTISEVDGFTEMGGMINFIEENQRIRFEVNQDTAEREALKISSKLLRLASRVVQPGDGRRS